MCIQVVYKSERLKSLHAKVNRQPHCGQAGAQTSDQDAGIGYYSCVEDDT